MFRTKLGSKIEIVSCTEDEDEAREWSLKNTKNNHLKKQGGKSK